ncbi:MAG: ABC transporter ATP-binding protein [Geitlerinemataceae cyanobacterium]
MDRIQIPLLSKTIDLRRVSYFGRALAIVWNSGRIWTFALWTISISQSVLPFLRLYIMKLLLDSITTGAATDGDFQPVLPLIVAMGSINLFGALISSFSRLVSELQGQRVSDRMFEILHGKAAEVDLSHYESAEYYDIMSRAQSEARGVPLQLSNRIKNFISDLVRLATLGGALLVFDWRLFLLLVVPIVPRIGIRFYFIDEIQKWVLRRTATQRQASYYNSLLTSDNHAKELRLFGLGELFQKRFYKIRRKLLDEKFQLLKRRTKADFSTTLLSVVAMWGAYAFIAIEAVAGAISVGDLVLYNQSFRKAYDSIWSLLKGIAGLYEDMRYLEYLFEFLDFEPEIVDPPDPKPVPKPMETGLEFRNVDFSYPGSARQALTDVSLTLQPGEVIALVGENGSGKTTLTKLLCRLYDPTSGQILLDGMDLRDFGVRDLRSQISVIFQDYAKYQMTARENIWLGNITRDFKDPAIENAARRSGADEVIGTLPEGFENMLGKRFEGGEELSIGQWQKVAIARAFLRQSQIVVLDEPTSALDPKAEYEVFRKFRELLEDQAAVLVTHRLSTVKMADCIYVLEDGRIAEFGPHDALIARDGLYAHLFETQAQNYR